MFSLSKLSRIVCTLTLNSVYTSKKGLRELKKYNETVTESSKTAEVRRENNSSDTKNSKLVDKPSERPLMSLWRFRLLLWRVLQRAPWTETKPSSVPSSLSWWRDPGTVNETEGRRSQQTANTCNTTRPSVLSQLTTQTCNEELSVITGTWTPTRLFCPFLQSFLCDWWDWLCFQKGSIEASSDRSPPSPLLLCGSQW